MITDAQLLFSEGQDLSQTAAVYTSTNVYDRGPLYAGTSQSNVGISSLGEGTPLYFYWRCTETFASAGSATIQIQLVSDALVGGHDGNSIVHYDSGALDASTGGTPIAAGDFAFAPLPPRSIDGLNEWERYLAVLYTVGTATTTGGAITSMIVDQTSLVTILASGYEIDSI